MECLNKAWRARVYGLLPLNAELSPSEQDKLISLLGFEQLAIPRHGHRFRSATVNFYSIRGGANLPGTMDIVAMKRQGIWRHPVRNRQIAKLAERSTAQKSDLDEQRVVVLVENVEHALELAQLLPGWNVIVGAEVHTDGLTEKEKGLLAEEGKHSNHSIVTASGLQKIKLSDIDVLIRADGGTGILPLADQALIEANDLPSRPLQLVDFMDYHYPQLLQRSRQRKLAYRERGWSENGSPAVQGLMQHFLQTRPGGSQ